MTIAFIIEGVNDFFDNNHHPEIGLTRKIADSLHTQSVDVIQSFNQAHIAAMLRELPTNDWPAFVAVCVDFLSENYIDKDGFFVGGYPKISIIKNVIAPGFVSLILADELREYPRWFADLNDEYNNDTYSIFFNRLIQKRFENSLLNYKDFYQKTFEQSLNLSNRLSAQKLLEFLDSNPEITHVYALIGASHLTFADNLDDVEIIKNEKNIKKLKLTSNTREIIIELHGGTHGKMDNYYSLCQSLINERIITHIPQQSIIASSVQEKAYPLTQKEILKNYFYLFFVNLIAIPLGYEALLSHEPGCEIAMLNAYLHAFEPHTEITHDFLKNINKLVVAHLKNESAGQYRNSVGKYPIRMQVLDDDQNSNDYYSGTVEGLYEFINYWINQKTILHSMDFTYIADPDLGSSICALDDKPMFFKLNPPTLEPFTIQNYASFIRKTSQDKGYVVEVGILALNDSKDKEALIEHRMHVLLSEYSHRMQEAHTNEQKTVCITQYVQRIAQLRPFYDGNIRTCYVLLNKLLHDHGLSLTLLLNARRFSGCTLGEVVEMVKTGQIIYQQLLQHASTRIPFVFSTNDSSMTIQTISCESKPFSQERLFDNFCNKVIFNHIAETNVSLQQPASFFYHPHRMIEDRLILGCDAPPGSSVDLDGRTATGNSIINKGQP